MVYGKYKRIFIVIEMILIILVTLFLVFYFSAREVFDDSSSETVIGENELELSVSGNLKINSSKSDMSIASGTIAFDKGINNSSNYYLSIDILKNDYVELNGTYLLLDIKDVDGNTISVINGLTKMSIGSVSGFDITNSEGIIDIVSGKEITNDGINVTIDQYVFSVYAVNMDDVPEDFGFEASISIDIKPIV